MLQKHFSIYATTCDLANNAKEAVLKHLKLIPLNCDVIIRFTVNSPAATRLISFIKAVRRLLLEEALQKQQHYGIIINYVGFINTLVKQTCLQLYFNRDK